MKKREKIMEYVFLLICIFLFANGIPAMKKIGFVEFLTGTKWKPGNNKFGIFPMILGSIYVTGGALIIGVPVGVLTSVFMARFCPEGLYKFLKPVVNLLAGIPSIVYGFFGLVVLVPFIREHFKNSNGQSILCASILLGIMILPTIIGASEPTIRAVEQSYYEGALALGATHERSVFTVVVPAAIRYTGCGHPRRRTCTRRDDGGHDGRGQPAACPEQYSAGRPHTDDEHCHGDGLCDGSAPGGADRYWRGAVCVYSDYQSVLLGNQAKRKGVGDGADKSDQQSNTER